MWGGWKDNHAFVIVYATWVGVFGVGWGYSQLHYHIAPVDVRRLPPVAVHRGVSTRLQKWMGA